jgi:hypothetical protein
MGRISPPHRGVITHFLVVLTSTLSSFVSLSHTSSCCMLYDTIYCVRETQSV